MSKNQRSRKQHQPAITVDQFLEHLAGPPVDGYSGSDEALIRECMARFGYSRAEAIERLRELGGI
jgi:hypothetical protein